jgi:hypothetical protein
MEVCMGLIGKSEDMKQERKKVEIGQIMYVTLEAFLSLQEGVSYSCLRYT